MYLLAGIALMICWLGSKELKDVISDTFYQHKDKELINLVLSEDDWNSVEQLIEVLQPLKEATLP
jgi:hypothetical protein